jgi:hypothetical protein
MMMMTIIIIIIIIIIITIIIITPHLLAVVHERPAAAPLVLVPLLVRVMARGLMVMVHVGCRPAGLMVVRGLVASRAATKQER